MCLDTPTHKRTDAREGSPASPSPRTANGEPLKIVVGNKYRARGGKVYLIKRQDGDGDFHGDCVVGDCLPGDMSRLFFSDGRHYYGEKANDLIEEVADEVPALAAGQRWRTNDGTEVTIRASAVGNGSGEYFAIEGGTPGWWYKSHRRVKTEHTPGTWQLGHRDSLVELIAAGSAFWMVWRDGGESPKRKHETEEAAKAEARRLGRLFAGTTFHVLKAVGAVVPEVKKSDTVSLAPVTHGAVLRTRGGKLVHYITNRYPEDDAEFRPGEHALVCSVRYLDGGAENWIRLDGKAHRDGSTCPDDIVAIVSKG